MLNNKFCYFAFYLLITLIVSTQIVEARAQASNDDEVQVIRAGSTVMYKFRDEHGNMVLQDTPPPEYFEIDDNEVAQAITIPKPIVQVARFVPIEVTSKWISPSLWLITAALIASALFLFLQPLFRRFRSETTLDRCLRHSKFPAFHNVKLNSSTLGQAEADRIVRTPSGFLVLNVTKLSGELRGAADKKEWRLSRSSDVTMVVNPLYRLELAMRIVSEVVGEIPLFDRVIDTGRATYANGMPPKIQKLSGFKAALASFDDAPHSSRAQDAAWRVLMRFPRSNQLSIKYYRDDWVGWMQKNWRTLAGASLLIMGAGVAAINLVVVT